MVRVLFVCLGNICRSPLAEGVFADLVEKAGLSGQIEADSAGTGAWHVGESPDSRSVRTARTHGVDISGQRARRFEPADLDRFDVVMAMDSSNLAQIQRHDNGQRRARIGLILGETSSVRERDVPDPYYGRGDGFERAWKLVCAGSEALLDRIRSEHNL